MRLPEFSQLLAVTLSALSCKRLHEASPLNRKLQEGKASQSPDFRCIKSAPASCIPRDPTRVVHPPAEILARAEPPPHVHVI